MTFYSQMLLRRSINTRVCRFSDLLELRHHAVRATLAPGIPLQGGLEPPHVSLLLSLLKANQATRRVVACSYHSQFG